MYPIGGRPIGYQQVTALGSSVGLTIPAGATQALVTVSAQTVRVRGDGVAPTAAVGFPLTAETTLLFNGNLSSLRFIQTTAGAVVDVLYFG